MYNNELSSILDELYFEFIQLLSRTLRKQKVKFGLYELFITILGKYVQGLNNS